MPVCGEDDVGSIAAEIMEYLRKRPMASDSLDGIIHWWLVQQSIARNRALVEQTLEQLAKEGKVIKRASSNRKAVYSLDPDYRPK
jgi:hypothetical protein